MLRPVVNDGASRSRRSIDARTCRLAFDCRLVRDTARGSGPGCRGTRQGGPEPRREHDQPAVSEQYEFRFRAPRQNPERAEHSACLPAGPQRRLEPDYAYDPAGDLAAGIFRQPGPGVRPRRHKRHGVLLPQGFGQVDVGRRSDHFASYRDGRSARERLGRRRRIGRRADNAG